MDAVFHTTPEIKKKEQRAVRRLLRRWEHKNGRKGYKNRPSFGAWPINRAWSAVLKSLMGRKRGRGKWGKESQRRTAGEVGGGESKQPKYLIQLRRALNTNENRGEGRRKTTEEAPIRWGEKERPDIKNEKICHTYCDLKNPGRA